MATHSSILAWRIPWTEEPGRLQSMGSQRVRHDCRDLTTTPDSYRVLMARKKRVGLGRAMQGVATGTVTHSDCDRC